MQNKMVGRWVRFAPLSLGCLALCAVPAFSQNNALSKADKQFLSMAAETNMTEAHFGEMAQSQATSQAAKDFGQKLAQDHATAYSELLRVAQKDGDNIPRGIDIRKNANITHMAALKGKAFDKAFARDEVMDHQRALAMFQREADHGSNPDVKAYAAKQLSTLRTHLQMAKDLNKAI